MISESAWRETLAHPVDNLIERFRLLEDQLEALKASYAEILADNDHLRLELGIHRAGPMNERKRTREVASETEAETSADGTGTGAQARIEAEA